MAQLLKVLPPMFASLGECKQLDLGTAQYLINLLMHRESAKLLLEGNHDRLAVICGALTGNHPGDPLYLHNSLRYAAWPPVSPNEGTVVCLGCRSIKGRTSYGSFLLASCVDCRAQKRSSWSLADSYYASLVARCMLLGVRELEQLAISSVESLDKSRNL